MTLPPDPRWTARRAELGFTLAELTISMALFSVLSVMVMAATTQSHRLFRDNMNREQSGQQASLVIEQSSRDLRTAVKVGPAGNDAAFAEATVSSVTFYSSVAADPVRERLYVDTAGVFWRQTTLPDTSSASPSYTYATNRGQQTTRLARNLLDTGSLFAYLLDDGSVITGAVPVTSYDNIVGVKVLVKLSVDPAGSHPVLLQNTVRPYNL